MAVPLAGLRRELHLGRCDDCNRRLALGLEGTWCEPCEVACPSCGEAECHASCAAELAAARERMERQLRRVQVDLRRATENRRQVERAVWLLSGARS